VRRWENIGPRKDVLINWIETYVQLSGEDAAEYQRLLNLKGNEEIRQMEQTWLGKAEARGIKKGRTEGLKKGRTEGRAQAVEQMRQMVLREIERRFGAVPTRVAARVRAIRTLEPLGKMLKDLSIVQSADDLLSRRRGLSES
jgi:flagellar biosynthesis/type III secretory pathway protein FliH